jgi:3-phosphoshikimate 1-carboxyvinyltransferase
MENESGTLLRVEPLQVFSGTFRTPASKPETQRAILASSLAGGVSRIFNDLRCDETRTMKDACRAFGADITEHDGHLEIKGVGGVLQHNEQVIRADGSAFVFRTAAALASACSSPVVVTGDGTIRRRVMYPLFDALRDLGADIETIFQEGHAPIVSWGRGLKGGACRLPGDVSSQFITAILFAAPLAQGPVEIEVVGEVYSKSYITQSLTSLTNAGVKVTASGDYRSYRVEPSSYNPRDVTVHEDYTSASYLLAAAALYPGTSILTGMRGASEQGEFAIIPILRHLGLEITFDQTTSSLVVKNPLGRPRGTIEVDAKDCVNIVPTLAAIGAYVDGSLRVVGGRLTRFHKTSRIEAIVSELSGAGVDIEAIYEDGICDGFVVRGLPTYPGGQTFSNWGDHRIFMSLFVAGLRMESASTFSGFEGVRLSFPEFFSEFAKTGVQSTVVESPPELRSSDDSAATAFQLV